MIEEYDDLENSAPNALNAPDAPNASATTATPGGYEYKTLSQTGQIMHQSEGNLERDWVGHAGILRATSGNAPKWLKLWQEARMTTRARKSAEAAIKQIAAQEL